MSLTPWNRQEEWYQAMIDAAGSAGGLPEVTPSDAGKVLAVDNSGVWVAQYPSGGGGTGLSDEVKQAILDIFEKVAYTDSNGQQYYNALYEAFYQKSVVSISAVFTQGSAIIYDTDTLEDLKQYLVVTAHYDDNTSGEVLDYTLSGSLVSGTSTITVSYSNLTTSFSVNVTHDADHYSITNNLTGCYTSNQATSIAEGNSYSATITANNGYTLTGATVSILMNNVDITSTAYANGTISIASVTGNIVITISCSQIQVESITATYNQSGTVYANADINSFKSDLVVTAHYNNSSTAVVPSSDYTLSGTLEAGTSAITVTYEGLTDTFNVTVDDEFLWDYTQGMPNGCTIDEPQNGSVTMTENGINIKCTATAGNNINLKMPDSLIRSIDSYDYIFTVKPVTLSNASWAGLFFKIADGAKSIVWVHFKTNGTFSKDVKINDYIMTTNTSHTVKFSGADVYIDGTKLATLTDIAETATSRVYVGAAVSPTELYLQSIKIERRN